MGGAWKRNCHQVKAKHDERAFVNLKGKEAKPSIPTLNNSTFSLLPSFLFPFSLSLFAFPYLLRSLPPSQQITTSYTQHFTILKYSTLTTQNTLLENTQEMCSSAHQDGGWLLSIIRCTVKFVHLSRSANCTGFMLKSHAQTTYTSQQETVWEMESNFLGLFPKCPNQIARLLHHFPYSSTICLSSWVSLEQV